MHNPEPAESASVNADPRSPAFCDRFGAFLLEDGSLDEISLKRAQRAQRQNGDHFPLVLIRLGLLNEQAIAAAIARFCRLPLVNEEDFPTVALSAEAIDASYLKHCHMLPLRLGDGIVEVAVADPFNAEAIAALAFLLDSRAQLHVASYGDIEKGIERLYGAAPESARPAGEIATEAASDEDVRRLEDMASEAPVIRLVHDLITRAAGMQASDIHIEPREDCVRVRFRIDGILHTVETLPASMKAAIGSRIKIMARLNIAERRLPQDGRIKENVRGREIDLRVSTMPTLWGESTVLRILDRAAVELDFAKLGFSADVRRSLASLLGQPNGIILVTGPTGSGKTTTLYTALGTLDSVRSKIFTVEDPIEYQMPGINQIQVQPRIGLTFAHALRSILRQDPDMIMVGEIRDLETAQIAIQASLTGHLVLSTVHTNSAAATITRLIDMGVERYLLAASLRGVLAQRLVRRLCPACTAPAEAPASLLEMMHAAGAGQESPRLMQAVGCPACRNTGYAGRTTIFELLTTTEAVRNAMLSGSPEHAIAAAGERGGMRSLIHSGIIKVIEGETTFEEVLRATRFDTCLDTAIASTTAAAS
jgi:general secretion pathway protein E